MRAFFEPLYVRQDRVPGEADPGPFQDYDYSTIRKIQQLGAVRAFDKTPDAPTWFYSGGDERNRQSERGSIPPGVPAFLDFEPITIEPIQLPPVAWYPGLDAELRQTMLDDARKAVSKAESELAELTKSKLDVPQAALDQLATAEAAYRAELDSARREGRLTAIAGKQSLLLDATQGRRVLQNRLLQLKNFDEGFTIRFQLLLTTDGHFNFQLAKHLDKGLTAALVAFDKGRLVSYQPRTLNEFEVGRYDFAARQNRFEIQLVLQPSEDQCLLTIRSLSDDRLLAAEVPVALNGWNPIVNPDNGIFLDAQTGCIAAVDELSLGPPPPIKDQITTSKDLITTSTDALDPESARRQEHRSRQFIRFSFESPPYLIGQDVVGLENWQSSSFTRCAGNVCGDRRCPGCETFPARAAVGGRKASDPDSGIAVAFSPSQAGGKQIGTGQPGSSDRG